jgi:hypothetical protein
MLKTIITFICLTGITNLCFGQEDLNNNLFALEKEIYYSASEGEKSLLALQKFYKYLQSNEVSREALWEARRVNDKVLPDTAKDYFYWNTALAAHLLGEFNVARQYYHQYESNKRGFDTQSALLRFFIYTETDTTEALNTIKALEEADSRFSSLHCFMDMARFEKKGRGYYVLASALVPGLGNILLGEILAGANSLAFTSASAIGIIYLVQANLYANAILWGTGFGLKFYFGNLLLTNNNFTRKGQKEKNQLAKDCELVFQKILEDYPLRFRF